MFIVVGFDRLFYDFFRKKNLTVPFHCRRGNAV